MTYIILNLLGLAFTVAILWALFRVVVGFLDLIKQTKGRMAIENEMLKEIKQLNAKLDTLLAAANLQNNNRFIPGGKSEN